MGKKWETITENEEKKVNKGGCTQGCGLVVKEVG